MLERQKIILDTFFTGRVTNTGSYSANMGESNGISYVLHRHFSWIRQRMAISLRRLPKRWRRLPHTVPNCTNFDWKTYVLPGNVPRAVQ